MSNDTSTRSRAQAAAPAANAPAKLPRLRPVPAVTRSIAILRLLGHRSEAMGVKAIAQALEMVPSTCLHILRVLVQEKLLEVESDTKRYRLGTGMLTLARSVLHNNSFRNVVQPTLERLSAAWEVTAIGVEVSDLDHMVVLALERSPLPFSLHVDVGSRFPALISATGRLVAAFSDQPWKEIERRFKQLRWQHPLDLDVWRKDLAAVKKRGYSVDRGDYINGVTIVAVPVMNASGRVTHTIVGAGVSHQLNGPQITALAKDMQAEAARLAQQLFSVE